VLKTFFFVYIGISIPFSDSKSILIGALITIFLLLSRIIIAKYCSPKGANVFDKSTIGLMIPKGLAAAVLASVPEQMGMPSGSEIKYITFSVVLFSILICSIMILLIEKQPKMNVLFRFVFKQHVKRKPKVEQVQENQNEEQEKEVKEIEKEVKEIEKEVKEIEK
jgi:NhaP-type Na+/H+ or K+/H+ antiporter